MTVRLPDAGCSRVGRFLLVVGLLVGAPPALAEVTEPDGTVVPQPGPDHETPLQTYFDTEGEAIDSVADASAEPGMFSPLCDFEATLVMSESGADAGIAWYNVPADPNAPPTEVYEIIPDTAAVGQTFGSSDIRDNANYAGGNIGFVLTKSYMGNVYYSEYLRNEECSSCTYPGHWKMMLAYPSTLDANTYYLAWEDWEGADEDNQNDGDFNDKVFKVSGVVCLGGGEPCDTGGIGVCALGRTECVVGGELVCRPQLEPTPEVCDNLDNDCNGEVDDGEGLCDAPNVCFRGKCVPPCGTGEFACPPGFSCEEDVCVDLACQGVICTEGQICVGGNCVGGCEGVVCPLGQVCQLGRCVDLCQGVECPIGEVCREGVCVVSCACGGCPMGEECAASGECVSPGCGSVTCAAGEECVEGTCVDACAGAVCPGGAECVAGVCGEADPTVDPGGDDPVDPIDVPVIPGSGGTGEPSSGTGANGTANGGGNLAAPPTSSSGCGCRLAGSGGAPHGHWLALAFLGALGVRRRRVRVQCARAEWLAFTGSGDGRHRGSARR